MKKELQIPHAVGFCKNCFRSRRDGSAYCGECKDEPEKIKLYVSDDQFPLLHKVVKKFNLEGNVGSIIFTYGDTIYTQKDMPAHLIAHEVTHCFQQIKMGVKEWWDKYLKDDQFRLIQEVEAYRQQYKVAMAKSAEDGAYVLRRTAEDLSGGLYGNIVDLKTAIGLIIGTGEIRIMIDEAAPIKEEVK